LVSNSIQVDEKYVELSLGISDGKLFMAIISIFSLYENTGVSQVVFSLYNFIGLFGFE
jgi:hypothetical protein